MGRLAGCWVDCGLCFEGWFNNLIYLCGFGVCFGGVRDGCFGWFCCVLCIIAVACCRFDLLVAVALALFGLLCIAYVVSLGGVY